MRGGVPVDMLSVPRLPLRLHSLAASRTGSKRLAREVEEDAEAGADMDMDACAGTGELSRTPPPPPPPRDAEEEGRGVVMDVVERRRLGSACEKRAGS